LVVSDCADDSPEMLLQVKRIGTLRFTPASAIALAIRRCFCNIAAGNVGNSLLQDISRQTVTRAEVTTGGAMAASTRSFHAVQERWAVQSEAPVISCFSFQGDATNSSVWQGSKLSGLHLTSAYIAVSTDACCRFSSYARMTSAWADPQRVAGSDGPSAFGMVRKQLQSLGCPVSVDFSDHTSERIALQFVCTDAGPDQKAFRLGWGRSGGSGFDNLDFSFWLSRRLQHHAPRHTM
jgi:hypothetical protein